MPKEVKELERAGVRPGKVAKKEIMRKLEGIRLKKLEQRAEELLDILEKVDVRRVVAHIKEDCLPSRCATSI